ncbi:MAG: lysylphosphatidylglycerol synthase transmembrane domain-containing protein [Eubacteriales bacterium]|nr:lysylphosphatidylglycerol synthase transmembrane domain-containing protein [Eubacteriales bacterium]
MEKRKAILNVGFLAVVFACTVWAVFRGEDLGLVLTYMKTAKIGYLLWGIVCVVTFIWGESIIIWYLLRTLGRSVHPGKCYLYSFIGFFFSCITPSASGGQPAQIYYMKKGDIPVPESTLILMIVTITYKMVLVVIGAFVLVFRPQHILAYLQPVLFWMYLGITLNVFCVGAMLVLVFHPRLASFFLIQGLRMLERLHILKEKPERMEKLQGSMEQYHAAAEFYRGHKSVVVKAFLITIAQRMVLFFVTYLVYRAFGLQGERLFDIVLLQGMISVAVDMLPLPGGMGVSEKLFLSVFLPVFGGHFLLPGMILSRGISYYSQLLISAVMTAAANFLL